MTDHRTEIDPDRLKMFSFGVFTQLNGAVTAGMIHLGVRLGLFEAMAQLDAPATTQEIAERAGLDERWVREWVHNQAAARIVDADTSSTPDRFSLSPEGVAVLASPDHVAYGMGMFHRFPQTMAALDHMPESFRTGLGHDYDSHGCEGAIGIEKSFEPWMSHHLIETVIPALDGVADRLDAGASAIDIGCGAGGAVLMMAERFPSSTFVGYDISVHALERANERLAESGLTNARFADPREEPMPADGSADFVTTFDCIHDMTRPQEMMHSIRSAIADDGTWLLVDIKGTSHLRRERRGESDGVADVRHQRLVLHELCVVRTRRCRARHARVARREGCADVSDCRLRLVSPVGRGSHGEQLLRGQSRGLALMARLSELSRSIEGHVAIVTGAASGMGRATAHLFADEGARVVVADLGPIGSRRRSTRSRGSTAPTLRSAWSPTSRLWMRWSDWSRRPWRGLAVSTSW